MVLHVDIQCGNLTFAVSFYCKDSAYILHLSLSKCFTLLSLSSREGKGDFRVPFLAPSYK